MMSGADGNSLLIEGLANFFCFATVQHEGDNASLFPRSAWMAIG